MKFGGASPLSFPLNLNDSLLPRISAGLGSVQTWSHQVHILRHIPPATGHVISRERQEEEEKKFFHQIKFLAVAMLTSGSKQRFTPITGRNQFKGRENNGENANCSCVMKRNSSFAANSNTESDISPEQKRGLKFYTAHVQHT